MAINYQSHNGKVQEVPHDIPIKMDQNTTKNAEKKMDSSENMQSMYSAS